MCLSVPLLLQALFQHVLSGEVAADRLVRMTPEQLASHELAKWREREVKHVRNGIIPWSRGSGVAFLCSLLRPMEKLDLFTVLFPEYFHTTENIPIPWNWTKLWILDFPKFFYSSSRIFLCWGGPNFPVDTRT